MAKYLAELNRIADDLENLCGLRLTQNGRPVLDMGVEEVMDFCQQQRLKLPPKSLKDLNVSVSRKMVILTYVESKLRYYNRKKLDFSGFVCMTDIAKTLLTFSERKSVTDDALVQLDRFIIILSDIEEKDSTIRTQLSFRFLRLFLVFAVYGFFCNVGIMSQFILEQLIVKEK